MVMRWRFFETSLRCDPSFVNSKISFFLSLTNPGIAIDVLMVAIIAFKLNIRSKWTSLLVIGASNTFRVN